jgi:hypothetical protein
MNRVCKRTAPSEKPNHRLVSLRRRFFQRAYNGRCKSGAPNGHAILTRSGREPERPSPVLKKEFDRRARYRFRDRPMPVLPTECFAVAGPLSRIALQALGVGERLRIPMNSQIAPQRSILQRQITHASLWLVICLGGGSMATLALYLAARSPLLDQGPISQCSAQVE